MAKDRAKDARRQFKDVGSLQRMGEALGWSRTTQQGVERAHRTSDSDAAAKIHHTKDSFVPGAGNVNDNMTHSGWLGIGGRRIEGIE